VDKVSLQSSMHCLTFFQCCISCFVCEKNTERANKRSFKLVVSDARTCDNAFKLVVSDARTCDNELISIARVWRVPSTFWILVMVV